MVGRILNRLAGREEVVITTKMGYDTGTDPNAGGHSCKSIMNGIGASLRRVDMDYVDIHMLHSIDMNTPFEETMGALNDIVRGGKERYLGVREIPL